MASIIKHKIELLELCIMWRATKVYMLIENSSCQTLDQTFTEPSLYYTINITINKLLVRFSEITYGGVGHMMMGHALRYDVCKQRRQTLFSDR